MKKVGVQACSVKQCGECGQLCTTDHWKRHWERNTDTHDAPYFRELLKGVEPRLGYWWEARKAPREIQEKPANYDGAQKSICKFVKEQLYAGKLIPWYFREYGKVIVHEMFMKHETFMHSRAKLRYPTKEDREKYESLEIKSRIELLDTLKGYV